MGFPEDMTATEIGAYCTEAGWAIGGRNVEIEVRWAAGQPDRFHSAETGEESSRSAETSPPAPSDLSPETSPPDSPSLMRRGIELFGPSILAIVGLVVWWSAASISATHRQRPAHRFRLLGPCRNRPRRRAANQPNDPAPVKFAHGVHPSAVAAQGRTAQSVYRSLERLTGGSAGLWAGP